MHSDMAAADVPLGSDLAISRKLQIKPFGSILSQPSSTFAPGYQRLLMMALPSMHLFSTPLYSVQSAKLTSHRSLPARSEGII